MSQQEFDPQFQAQEQDASLDEVYYPRAPYSWSGELDQGAAPRDEPPSSYSERDLGRDQSSPYIIGHPGEQEQAYSDGSASTYQRGYGPYNPYDYRGGAGVGGQGQGVPPWARPQQHRRAPVRFGFIMLVLVIVALIEGLVTHGGMLVGAGADILGAMAGLILFVLIVPLIILVVFSGLLRRMFRPGGSNNSGRPQRWRGRSWPNGPYWW